jgi:hypothetical protein
MGRMSYLCARDERTGLRSFGTEGGTQASADVARE